PSPLLGSARGAAASESAKRSSPCPLGRARSRLRRLPNIGTGVGHEPVPVWHFDLREGPGIEDVLLANDAVQIEEVRGDRIDFVGREGAGRVEGLSPPDEAPERGGVLPEAPDGEDGLAANERVD